jgi:hypothetical protein
VAGEVIGFLLGLLFISNMIRFSEMPVDFTELQVITMRKIAYLNLNIVRQSNWYDLSLIFICIVYM